MPKIDLAKPFKFAHRGHTVIEYEPGQHEVTERCAECAKEAGVLKSAKSSKPAANKSVKPASNK